MASCFPGDTVELLWEVTVKTEQGNVYTYPTGTRLTYVSAGTEPGTAVLDDGEGNLFPNVPDSYFHKI
jgi:hypothetical protein